MFSFFKKLDKRSRAVVFACYFAFMCNGLLNMMMGSMLPDLKAEYGLSDTVSGLFLSAHSAGNVIAGFVSALVPLFLGERKSIMLLSGMAILGFGMTVFWGNPVWLFLAFICIGFGRGSITNFTNRTVNRLTGGNPSASNCLHATFAVGAIVSPMAFLFLSLRFGWRAGPIFVAGCFLLNILSLSRMKLDVEYPDRNNRANRTLVFLKNPSFLILAGMMFCYVCSEYSVNGWLVTYIQNKQELLNSFGKSGAELDQAVKAYSQTMATLLWVVMLIGRLACAFASAKVPQKKLMMGLSLGMIVFFALLLTSSTIPMVTLSVAGLGFCMSGMSPMIYSDSATFSNVYPMVTSVLLVVGAGGSIIMNSLVGILADHFGFKVGMGAIFVTVIILGVLAILNVAVKTRRPQEA